MTVREFLISHPENDEFPLILINENGSVKKFERCRQYYFNPKYSPFPKYLSGACQLDLDGESSFVIIFCKEE